MCVCFSRHPYSTLYCNFIIDHDHLHNPYIQIIVDVVSMYVLQYIVRTGVVTVTVLLDVTVTVFVLQYSNLEDMYFPDDDVDFSVSAITDDDVYSQTDSLTLASEGGGVSSYSVRRNIRQTVEEIRVLDEINEKDERNEWLAERSRGVTERCLVCTLIYGTCEHTREWVDLSSPSWTRPPGYSEQQLTDEDLLDDSSIDDILNVVGELKIDTKPVLDDIDISTMQWNALEQLLSDKIGSTDLCLFAPDERGWHSTVSLNPKLIVVFGGFKYK